MDNHLPMDLTVDKAARKIYISRSFDADLASVWDAFTKAELLDRWVAPKPFVSKTKSMDFKVGGQRLYAMVNPEGKEHWAVQQYHAISPMESFRMFNAFADQDGNPQLPGSEWHYTFREEKGITTVRITIYNESLERMETMIAMGFIEGYKASMSNLDEVLTLKN